MNPVLALLLLTGGTSAVFRAIAENRGKKASSQQKPTTTASQYSPLTATPTVPPQTQKYSEIPRLDGNSRMILDSPVATESAKRYIEDILTSYIPKTPDVPRGWRSPLLDYTQDMAESAYANKLHPALAPLMYIAETQAMRPAASGTQVQNPANIMEPGTQNLYDYRNNGGLQRAVRRWPENVAKNWQNPNITKWRTNPTLESFVNAYNPTDNPRQEFNTIMQLIKSLNL